MDGEYLFSGSDAKGGSQRLRILRFNKTAFISKPSPRPYVVGPTAEIETGTYLRHTEAGPVSVRYA